MAICFTPIPQARKRSLDKQSAEFKPDSLESNVCRILGCFGAIQREPETEGLPIPPESTGYTAGSLAKIEVMRQRVEQGFSPFHPDDNPRVEVQAVRRYFPEPEDIDLDGWE